MSELCMNLLCPPAVEERLLDLLLMLPNVAVFTSTSTAAHGLTVPDLSQAEQVLGRARATEVRVIIRAEDSQALLQELRQRLTGTGLRYWLTPIIETGEIA